MEATPSRRAGALGSSAYIGLRALTGAHEGNRNTEPEEPPIGARGAGRREIAATFARLLRLRRELLFARFGKLLGRTASRRRLRRRRIRARRSIAFFEERAVFRAVARRAGVVAELRRRSRVGGRSAVRAASGIRGRRR